VCATTFFVLIRLRLWQKYFTQIEQIKFWLLYVDLFSVA